MTDEPLRIGVLGAARIAELSIVGPARACGHRLVAVAARDRDRAEAFAAAHGVERVAGSYADLVGDPEVEVVYNPLANGLHGPWNLAALRAGKHVLTEKPSASNAEEATEVHQAVARAGTVFMEGFHYLFHPVTRRLHELLDSGELGDLRHVEAMVAMPAPPDSDVRWSLPLAGGALMDLGCYSLHALRMLAPWAGGAPRLAGARGGERTKAPGVDEWLYADLEFPGGATGTARCHMAYHTWQMSCRVVGTRGEATATNFVQPHLDDRVVVRTAGGERTEELGRRSSYTYQLEALAAQLRHGAPPALDADDALTTMRLIDACYRAAGFPVRPRTLLPATA
ncbi:Gfo/Idh/MocA family protein [Streptomyces sp. NPDC056660]|uniref:Gfo/Idh/MocA family protein n=1 Tax=Streptomyces sp. NPDC056660 TaxID=3345897 RepID=UPI00368471DF